MEHLTKHAVVDIIELKYNLTFSGIGVSGSEPGED